MDNTFLEEYVLAGLYQFGQDAFIELDGIINKFCFTNEVNQLTFLCIELAVSEGRKLDLPSMTASSMRLSISDAYEKHKDKISEIISHPVDYDNVKQYAKQLYKLYIIKESRKRTKLAFDKLGDFNGTEPISSILESVETPGYEIIDMINESGDEKPVNMGEGVQDYFEDKIANPVDMVGIPTPWPTFNRAIGGGLRKGGITLVAAAAKSGKSTFAKEVSMFLSETIPVLYIDTEMTKEEQWDRLIASLAQVDIANIETGKLTEAEKGKVRQAYKKFSSHNLHHKCVHGCSFDEILSIIRRWIYKEVGLQENGKTNDCLVVYDYFKIMDHEKELKDLKEYEAIYYNASKLTDFSKELDFPVLSFVQLNRESQVAQSQRLEWIAKSINFLYRKTEDEMKEYPMAGTGKLVPGQMQRYGHNSLEPGDYINIIFDKNTNTIKEGLTYFEVKSQMSNSGFESDDEEEVLF